MPEQEKDRMNREMAEALSALGLSEAMAWEAGFLCERGHWVDHEFAPGECAYSAFNDDWGKCRATTQPTPRPRDFTDPGVLITAADEWKKKQRLPIIKVEWVENRQEWVALYRGDKGSCWAHKPERMAAEHGAFHRILTA
ncbi:MAG: hypothetical protein M1272_07790 [Firmicutes bacterium]|nr:hypothetical protein [Bacillota bacterium]